LNYPPRWKAKFGRMDVSEARRGQGLEIDHKEIARRNTQALERDGGHSDNKDLLYIGEGVDFSLGAIPEAGRYPGTRSGADPVYKVDRCGAVAARIRRESLKFIRRPAIRCADTV